MGAAKKLETDRLPTSSRYKINKCIARGGMGAVYMGVQRGAAGFQRQVAIKRTHPHLLEDAQTRRSILEEARNASAVRHPNVVSIDDVEEADGELLLVMDFVEGGSLSQLLSSSVKMPLGVALRILIDACAGLSAIHSALDADGTPLGLVHRDMSPQNVLVGLDGVARITDFGIAKKISDPKRTAKTVRRGKYGYMAPEYVKTGTTTQSSDMFGFGVVMWETIAGRRLFKADSNMDTLRLALAAEVPSLCVHVPEVPAAIDDLIVKCLARLPADRFVSMRKLGEKLEQAVGSLVASREEVSQYVSLATKPVAPKTMEISAEEILEEETGSVDAIASGVTARAASQEVSGEAEISKEVTDAREALEAKVDREMPPSSRLLHPAFCLEEKIAALPLAQRPLPVITAPVVVRKAPKGRLVALGIFCVAVITATAGLVYAVTADDGPAAHAQQISSH